MITSSLQCARTMAAPASLPPPSASRAVSVSDPTLTVAPALTRLSEDEQLFADNVYAFARTRDPAAGPGHGRTDGAIDRPLLPKLFDLGLMGIEIPRAYGGAGRTCSRCWRSRHWPRRPGRRRLGRRAEHAGGQRVLRRGNGDQKRRYLPRLAAAGAFASRRQAGSGRLRADHPRRRRRRRLHVVGASLDDQCRRGRRVPGVRHVARRRLRAHRVPGGPRLAGLPVGRRRQARHPGEHHLRPAARRVPVPGEPPGRGGRGLHAGDRDPQHGPLGIAAQLLGLARGALTRPWPTRRSASSSARRSRRSRACSSRWRAWPASWRRPGCSYNAARSMPAPFLRVGAMASWPRRSPSGPHRRRSTFGGNGLHHRPPVEKLYRDAKIGKIYEGTTHMQLATIAKQCLSPGGGRG